MNDSQKAGVHSPSFELYVWILAAVWSVIAATSLVWNVIQVRRNTLEAARIQAWAAFEKDVIYRRWNAERGGVYASVTEETQPNPYLNVPERNVVTPLGRPLTLINPAYMTRQVHKLAEEKYGVLGHITSLNPIRPQNAPDAWERGALQAFERGRTEVSSVEEMKGEEYLRFMRPLITEKGCLKCHAAQGYEEGDIRGGISVSVPMEPLRAISRMQALTLALGHVLLWLMGLAGGVLGLQRLRRSERERNRAAEALEKAKENAEVANRAKSEFLASMSHELRTPLNAILGYTQVLKRGESLTDDQEQGLGIIKQSGEHLLTLINDILDLAKIEAGRLELYPKAFDFSRLMEMIGSIIRMRVREKGIDYKYDAPTDLPAVVCADEKRLRQVLINLLGNAVKFTDSGRVTLRVGQLDDTEADKSSAADTTSDEQQTVLLRFEVEDTGVGIGPDQLDKIFQPFEQVGKMQQREGGTGLGLAISRALVRAMGSDLQVGSEPGKGSVFWFDVRLPIVARPEEPEEKEVRKIVGYKGKRRSVLVVDDDRHSRSVLRRLMEPLGFDVAEATNGKEGVELARSLRPDVVVMDMRMPVMTGLEAVSRIRQIEELRDTAILGFSASVFESDKEDCLRAGCDGFISKPLAVDELFAAMRSCLKVEWVYAEVDEEGAAGREEEEDEGRAEIVAPPTEEIAILYDLAIRGNMHEILNRASHLETMDAKYRPFARTLRKLAQAFEDEKILSLIKEYKE